jgi:hypothetical protein
MQMLLARLTPAVFISLGNAAAGRCNLFGIFWRRCLGISGHSERGCCENPNPNAQV